MLDLSWREVLGFPIQMADGVQPVTPHEGNQPVKLTSTNLNRGTTDMADVVQPVTPHEGNQPVK